MSKIHLSPLKDDKVRPDISPKGSRGGFAVRLISALILLAGVGLGAFWLYARWQNHQTPVPAPTGPLISYNETPAPEPTELSIPSLKITAPFIRLGLNADHTLEVPK